jgi:4-amino-4-deoxy-L-arabinose transferase-like glycosyltransferase
MKSRIDKIPDLKIALAVSLIFTVLYISTFDHFNSGFIHDEFRDMLVARSIRQYGVPLFLEYNFYKHPPIFFFLIAMTQLPLDLSAAIVVLGFSFLSIFSFYFLARELNDEKLFAVIATILFAAHQNMWIWSNRFLHETSLIFIFVASIYFGFKISKSGWKETIFLGILMGLGFLDKVTCFLIPVIISSYLLLSGQIFRKKKKKIVIDLVVIRNLAISLIIGFLVYSPWVIYTSTNGAPNTMEIWIGQITGDLTWSSGGAEPWYYHIITLPDLLTWFIIPIFLFGIYLLFKQKNPLSAPMMLPLIWFLIVIVFFSIPSHKEVKFVNPAMPAGILLAAYGLMNLKVIDKSLRGKNILYISIFLAVLLSISSLAVVLYDGHWISDWTLWSEVQNLDSDGVVLAGPYWWAINLFTQGVFVDYLYGDFNLDIYNIIILNARYIVVDSSYSYVQDQSIFTFVKGFDEYGVMIYSVNWDVLNQQLISQGSTPMLFQINDESGNPVEGARLFSNDAVFGRTNNKGQFVAYLPEGLFQVDARKICYESKQTLIAVQNSTTYQCQSTTMCQPTNIVQMTMPASNCAYHPDFTLDRF